MVSRQFYNDAVTMTYSVSDSDMKSYSLTDNGVVIAASYWGKFKTTFQMLMIIFTIFNIYLENDVLDVISNILVYVALALTVISLIDYMLKNKDVLKDQK